MMVDNNHKIQTRIRRLVGQTNALERLIERGEESFIIQLEAVIAAAKSLLGYFLSERVSMNDKLTEEEKRLLVRIIKKY